MGFLLLMHVNQILIFFSVHTVSDSDLLIFNDVHT